MKSNKHRPKKKFGRKFIFLVTCNLIQLFIRVDKNTWFCYNHRSDFMVWSKFWV